MTADSSTAGLAPMSMPAIDFETYAREGNPHLGDGQIFKDHVIIFTGAAGRKSEDVRALNHEIMVTAGMKHPESAHSQLFAFRSIAPYVAGVIVPRAQLDTCMRWAKIEEMPNVIALQGKLANAVKARDAEFAEAREGIAQVRAHEEAAQAAQNTTEVGHDFISKWLGKLDASRNAEKPVEHASPTR